MAFLNALQVLIGYMLSSDKALRVLISDVMSQPDKVRFSDRNAFMLVNLLVRKYNQEIRLDIEITPEEVLLVEEGIDKETVKKAVDMIESDRDRFLMKIKVVHEQLLNTLSASIPSPESKPLRFLISLEREIIVFLSLISGVTALTIIRTMLREYGDPASPVYHVGHDQKEVSLLLQHLKIVIRGSGRFCDDEILSLLRQIKRSEIAFRDLGSGKTHENLVSRNMVWINAAHRKILSKSRR